MELTSKWCLATQWTTNRSKLAPISQTKLFDPL